MISLTERRPADVAGNVPSQWIFTGNLKGSATLDLRCAICDRQDLRATFEVRTVTSEATCEICESCLSKGAMALEQGAPILHGQELRHRLSEMAVRGMLRICKDVLRDILKRSNDSDLPELAVYFDRNAQLSPRYAATLFQALSSARVDADPRIFEVQMRSIEHQQEFGRLGEREKLAVWQVLSPTVRKRLTAFGLAPKHYALPQGKRTQPSRGQRNAADLGRHGLHL